ncbi:TonB-dependent siderophore receptor [Vineibacter terrae]|uniref:TonB-dependent siderophore receptor n=1 Tax=Vineibacter terrae TaxID=2586908 RepID=UPI002E3402E2|nr:TonB-dependent siderophore receptor [Vineibacter terrae]HEX2884814.1 TonB-dependent siderophore receptor [Vineibacter terrae]
MSRDRGRSHGRSCSPACSAAPPSPAAACWRIWRATEDTTLTLLASYQTEWGGETGFNDLPTSGTLRFNPNGRIPFHRYSGDPTFDRFSREQVSFGYALQHRFDETLTVRQNVRYTDLDVRLRALNRVGELLADNRTLNRAAFGIKAGAQSAAADNQAQLTFDTGPMKHVAVVGLDFRYEMSTYDVGRGTAPPIDIYNPSYGLPIADPGTSNFVRNRARQTQIGLYAQDQIKLGQWILTLGGRHDWVDGKTENRRIGSASRQSDSAFSGRVGLCYVSDIGIAPYVSYSTSFQPTSGTDFTGRPFDPSKGAQIEAGVKYQPFGSKTFVTLSAFHLKQTNVLTADPDPSHVGFSVQTGEVKARGIEIEGRTQLFTGLGLIASYTYLDHEISKSANPAEVGRRLPNTPVHQASLWLDYVFQDGPFAGLGLGGGIRYVGKTYDATNAARVPGYTLVDATVHYDLGRLTPPMAGARLTLTATNLFDKYYVSQCTNNAGCTLGQRRTIIAALNYQW